MNSKTQRTLMAALLAVPFMLGNRGCDEQSVDVKPDAGEGDAANGGGGGGGENAASGANGDSEDDAAASDTPAGACSVCPGPRPAAPNFLCTDGSTAGPLCAPDAAGACGWTIRACPADEAGDQKLPTCDDAACGPAPGANPMCADGSDANLSCLKNADDSCAWKFLCGGVDGPDAGSDDGAFCGGIAGIGCADGEYCDYGSTCGAADQGGKCAPKPELCTADFSPVCGCDDRTYSNACAAAGAGVSILSVGECGEPQACNSCAVPAPGAPNYACADGIHVGGPACVAEPSAACGWQILSCPEDK